MRKKVWMILVLLVFFLSGCGSSKTGTEQGEESMESTDAKTDSMSKVKTNIVLTEEITELEKGFSAVRYDGDYGFDRFLSEGGVCKNFQKILALTS